MGAEGQGGGPRHQVEDSHQGAALHALLQDVSTLLDGESEIMLRLKTKTLSSKRGCKILSTHFHKKK